MKTLKLTVALFCVWGLFNASVSDSKTHLISPRERFLFDFGWKFKLGDPVDIDSAVNYPEVEHLDKTWVNEIEEEIKFGSQRIDPVKSQSGSNVSYVKALYNDRFWTTVNLPHDWAVDLPYDSLNKESNHIGHGFKTIGDKQYKSNNIGWYRRSFTIPVIDKGKAIWVEFDGVYRNCLVWINGHCLGRNVSGYMGFKFDIAEYLNYGGQNTIVVRVDASRFEGWWYEGAGIYRHVWLVKTNKLHIAHWETYITSKVSGNNAKVEVQTQIRNESEKNDTCTLVSTLIDATGKQISESIQKGIICRPLNEVILTQTIAVNNAKLWSIQKPYLYKIVSTIQKKNTTVDLYKTPFGLRTIRFDKDSGLYLNGKRVLLKGVCVHQDHAGVGTAIPDRLQYYRLEKLKEMGCNAYRTSHNPPTPELLQACDESGILVIDETRRFSTDPEGKSQLEKLIRRDRNHPSIILWSIGNEEMPTQKLEAGRKLVTELQNYVHKLDPTRQVTLAVNDSAWGKPASQAIEVMGYNYLRNGNMDDFHRAYPEKPSVGSEEASSHSTRGIYSIDSVRLFASSYLPLMRYWSSTPEGWLQYYAKRPWLSGGFIWAGFDYRGEPLFRLWPSTASCYGVMDLCGFPKDPFYCYQASWSAQPVLHILPHWNWPCQTGKEIKVWAYSNCDEVELFLNDVSLGKKKTIANDHLEWMVKFIPGTLLAKGYIKGKLCLQDKVETTETASQISLRADRITVNADGEDISMITVSVFDAKGRRVPYAENKISFQIKGPGKIIGVGNGCPSSIEPDKASYRKVFNGLAQVIIQTEKQSGNIELTATASNLKSSTIIITAKKCNPRLAVQ